jgi:tetratricopeptide (TPR) repeat protein
MATASRFRLRFWFVVATACAITLCPAARSQESDGDKGITPTKVAQAINQVRASGAGEDILQSALGIGGALLRVGRFSEAADLFSALAEKKPHDAAILYGQALATFNSGRVTEAEGIARRAIDEAHGNEPGTDANRAQRAADALVLLAVILAVRGDDAAALKAVQQAVRIAPNHFDAQLALGRALFGMGDNDGAIRAFRAARSLQSSNAQALFFLATALERSGDIKGALSTYRELIASNPDMFEGHLGLGVLLLKRGEAEADEGLKELERALQINPNLY